MFVNIKKRYCFDNNIIIISYFINILDSVCQYFTLIVFLKDIIYILSQYTEKHLKENV